MVYDDNELERIRNAMKGIQENQTDSRIVGNYDHFVAVKDIECFDRFGNLRESHDIMYFAKHTDVSPWHQQERDFASSLHYSEKKGWFLPSMPLYLNCLVGLFQDAVEEDMHGNFQTKNISSKESLDKMLNENGESHCVWTNTITDYQNKSIKHYPRLPYVHFIDKNKDRPSYNLKLDRMDILMGDIHEVLQDDKMHDFMIDLTGLKNPSILSDIARYIGGENQFYCHNHRGTAQPSTSWETFVIGGPKGEAFGVYAPVEGQEWSMRVCTEDLPKTFLGESTEDTQ